MQMRTLSLSMEVALVPYTMLDFTALEKKLTLSTVLLADNPAMKKSQLATTMKMQVYTALMVSLFQSYVTGVV